MNNVSLQTILVFVQQFVSDSRAVMHLGSLATVENLGNNRKGIAVTKLYVVSFCNSNVIISVVTIFNGEFFERSQKPELRFMTDNR